MDKYEIKTHTIPYQYNVHANDLSTSIKDCKGLIDRLTEKIHHEHLEPNFPTFPHSMDQVPMPVKAYDDLKRIVRDTQKDFEFAVIREHRHTRQVLIGISRPWDRPSAICKAGLTPPYIP